MPDMLNSTFCSWKHLNSVCIFYAFDTAKIFCGCEFTIVHVSIVYVHSFPLSDVITLGRPILTNTYKVRIKHTTCLQQYS